MSYDAVGRMDIHEALLANARLDYSYRKREAIA